jgi:DNA-directed RNA polymerase specialized sigma24 family protein
MRKTSSFLRRLSLGRKKIESQRSRDSRSRFLLQVVIPEPFQNYLSQFLLPGVSFYRELIARDPHQGTCTMIESYLELRELSSLERHISRQVNRSRSTHTNARADFSAEDILQWALLQALLKRDQYREGTSSIAWLKRIATNRMHNLLRRRSRRGRQVEIVDFEAFAAVALASESERLAWIWEEVERLPKRYRNAIMAKFRLGLSGDSFVAEIGATSQKQAQRWLQDAKQQLKRRLNEMG